MPQAQTIGTLNWDFLPSKNLIIADRIEDILSICSRLEYLSPGSSSANNDAIAYRVSIEKNETYDIDPVRFNCTHGQQNGEEFHDGRGWIKYMERFLSTESFPSDDVYLSDVFEALTTRSPVDFMHGGLFYILTKITNFLLSIIPNRKIKTIRIDDFDTDFFDLMHLLKTMKDDGYIDSWDDGPPFHSLESIIESINKFIIDILRHYIVRLVDTFKISEDGSSVSFTSALLFKIIIGDVLFYSPFKKPVVDRALGRSYLDEGNRIGFVYKSTYPHGDEQPTLHSKNIFLYLSTVDEVDGKNIYLSPI